MRGQLIRFEVIFEIGRLKLVPLHHRSILREPRRYPWHAIGVESALP
jgi:hypothetical protein